MFLHCQLAIYNTFRVSALIYHIRELPMIIGKRNTPKSIGLHSFTVRNSLAAFVSYVMKGITP